MRGSRARLRGILKDGEHAAVRVCDQESARSVQGLTLGRKRGSYDIVVAP
jgi:hypothetical protein